MQRHFQHPQAAAGQRALSASDPWEGLVDFIQQANALLSRDRGLKQALLSRGAHKTECAREKIIPIATELVARAQQAGSLRADLDPLDLPLIDLMVSAIADMTREVSPELWQRALTIIIDGLATTRQTPTPLPGQPLGQLPIHYGHGAALFFAGHDRVLRLVDDRNLHWGIKTGLAGIAVALGR